MPFGYSNMARDFEMESYLISAGFEIEEITERPPYRDIEYDSDRVYILAKRPPAR